MKPAIIVNFVPYIPQGSVGRMPTAMEFVTIFLGIVAFCWAGVTLVEWILSDGRQSLRQVLVAQYRHLRRLRIW